MDVWISAGVLLSLTLAEGQTISAPNTIGIGQDLTLSCSFVPGLGQTIDTYQWSFTGAVTGLNILDDCTVFTEGSLAGYSYTKQCTGNDFTLTLQAVTQDTLSKNWCCNVGLVGGGAGTESCKTVGIDADCGNPTTPTNGQVSVTTTTYQSTATYSCDSGYTIDGTATTTCQADSTWSGPVPTCTNVDCGNPTTPTNGQVSVTTTTYQSTATYACDSGYTIDGTATTTTCQADGTWSGSVPTCTGADTTPLVTKGCFSQAGCTAGVVLGSIYGTSWLVAIVVNLVIYCMNQMLLAWNLCDGPMKRLWIWILLFIFLPYIPSVISIYLFRTNRPAKKPTSGMELEKNGTP